MPGNVTSRKANPMGSPPAGTAPVAIVTGAAGGVGREVVRLLHGRGFRIIAVELSSSVFDLERDFPGTIPIQGDISVAATSSLAVEKAISNFGRLDLLVNNAARNLMRSILETSEEEWDQLFAINSRGPFLFTRAALPELLESKGAIVNVASTSGLTGQPQQAAYAATKGALIQLSRQVAIDYAAAGVRVNVVAPGAIDTAFAREAEAAADDAVALRATVAARHPIGRFSTSTEVAEAIVFLGMDGASGITGSVLTVDGGYTAA